MGSNTMNKNRGGSAIEEDDLLHIGSRHAFTYSRHEFCFGEPQG
jgi:hypothetical protein